MTTAEWDFKFVDAPPPPQKGRNALYAAFREALRARPGEWAIWPREMKDRKIAQLTAGNINRGGTKSFPKDEFEARSSDNVVYVRYIGGDL